MGADVFPQPLFSVISDLSSCIVEGNDIYLPVPIDIVQSALDKSSVANRCSLIVNLSVEDTTTFRCRAESPVHPASPPELETLEEKKNALHHKLLNRRSANELINRGILPATSYQSAAILQQSAKLERARVESFLSRKLKHRPDKHDLVNHNILLESPVQPLVAEQQKTLKRRRIEDELEYKISHRPPPDTIQKLLNSDKISSNEDVRDQNTVQEMRSCSIGPVPTPPPLPASNPVRKACTSTSSVIKSGGFIFHEQKVGGLASTSEVDTYRSNLMSNIRNSSGSIGDQAFSIYHNMMVADLKVLCQQQQIPYRQKSTKKELVSLLLSKQNASDTAAAKSHIKTAQIDRQNQGKVTASISKQELDEIMQKPTLIDKLTLNSPLSAHTPKSSASSTSPITGRLHSSTSQPVFNYNLQSMSDHRIQPQFSSISPESPTNMGVASQQDSLFFVQDSQSSIPHESQNFTASPRSHASGDNLPTYSQSLVKHHSWASIPHNPPCESNGSQNDMSTYHQSPVVEQSSYQGNAHFIVGDSHEPNLPRERSCTYPVQSPMDVSVPLWNNDPGVLDKSSTVDAFGTLSSGDLDDILGNLDESCNTLPTFQY